MQTFIVAILTKVLTHFGEWALSRLEKMWLKEKARQEAEAARIEDNQKAVAAIERAQSEAERIEAARKHLTRK